MKRYLRSLERAARRYARLKVWGRDLSHVPFKIYFDPSEKQSIGVAWVYGKRRYSIIATNDVADSHDSILHELAHIALPGVAHCARFHALLNAAIQEVVGHWVTPPADPVRRKGNNHLRALRRHLGKRRWF